MIKYVDDIVAFLWDITTYQKVPTGILLYFKMSPRD